MKFFDLWHYGYLVLVRHKTRTLLLLLAVSLGVSSVLILTSLGEGAKLFITKEFSSLGNQMLIILPGKKETEGGAIPISAATERDLTIGDAEAIGRLYGVNKVAPIIAGTAQLTANGLSRDVITIGSNNQFLDVRKLSLASALPSLSEHLSSTRPVIILGAELKQTLFGNEKAIGKWVKLSQQKYRVGGVLEQRGESLGLDLRNMVIIPLLNAEKLFNSPSLFRILVEQQHPNADSALIVRIRQLIAERHDGEDDVTIISQNSVLSAFDRILTLVTVSIACIAAISLFVAGFLIMNVTYISVSRRREEIGILKTLGASKRQVQQVFLIESIALVAIGAFIGVVFAYASVYLAYVLFPAFKMVIPWWATLSSIAIALVIGVIFSWLPSAQAAKLDPILALRGQ